MLKHCRPAKLQAWKHYYYKCSYDGPGKQCGINTNLLNSAALNRSSWRMERHQAIEKFEETHVATLEHKRAARKYGVQPGSHVGVWPCDSCSRICTSRIGLYAHQRIHRWQAIRRSRRCSPRVCVCVWQSARSGSKVLWAGGHWH